jgi:hypothetical protein
MYTSFMRDASAAVAPRRRLERWAAPPHRTAAVIREARRRQRRRRLRLGTLVLLIACGAAIAAHFGLGPGGAGAPAPSVPAGTPAGQSKERHYPSLTPNDFVPDPNSGWIAGRTAAWVRRFVESAGYTITGHTPVAWIAAGSGASFYIYAEVEAPGKVKTSGDWTLVTDAEGTAVYGPPHRERDNTVRWWVVPGDGVISDRVIWIQPGPRGTSVIPAVSELALLARASRTERPPLY